MAQKQKELGAKAINRILPEDAKFDSVSADGRILFNVNGQRVATLSLSDGYRSVLALAGDLIWRLLMAFPESNDPLQEEGTVLIDELDIHLHPVWQRQIPGVLRELFPNLQFIVTTHSPFIAAGAGGDAVTYRMSRENGSIELHRLPNLSFLSVEKVLQSPAFGLVSVFSKETQDGIDRYYKLRKKNNRTRDEEKQLELILPVIQQAIGEPAPKSDLEKKVDEYLDKMLE